MSKIAVVGVHESIGREILSFLSEDGIKAADVCAVDVNSPLGTQVSYGEDDELDVSNLEGFDFSGIDLAVFAVTPEISKRYAGKALASECKVIDTSGAFIGESDVPMIIAGVNDERLEQASRGMVSIPSAAVTQMLVPLKAVDDKYHIRRLLVNSY